MSQNSKPPAAPDPRLVIQAQEQANHYNQSNPFGSATWSKGPDGQNTLTQSYSPQMQAALDRSFELSQRDSQKQYIPQGLSDLSSAVLGKVGQKYGLTPGQGFDTNMKNPYQAPPQANPGLVNGMGMGQPQGGPMGQASAMPMANGMPMPGGMGNVHNSGGNQLGGSMAPWFSQLAPTQQPPPAQSVMPNLTR